jgi:thymidylate synthase
MELKHKKYPDWKIARHFHVSEETLGRWKRKNDIRVSDSFRKPSEYYALKAQGLRECDIAQTWGISNQALYAWKKRNLEEIKTMNTVDRQYLDVANFILENGEVKEDRTGTGTISVFSPPEMRVDLQNGFPLLTTKKLHIPSIVHELIWFLKGDTNVKTLQENGIKIWNADYERVEKAGTHQDGDLGPIYGAQWRRWETGEITFNGYDDYPTRETVDQIKELITSLKENPNSRRHIVNAWNVGQLKKMALPPCHIFFQCYVSNDGGLSLKMYQRSADWFLGVPFNIASYSLLVHMIAQVTGLYAKEFIWTGGDSHIYLNHVEQIKEQLSREPKQLPTLELNPFIKDIDEFTAEDIIIKGYDPHPLIKGTVSAG